MAWTTDTRGSLLKLAQAKFSKLTEADQRFFQAIEAGEQADFREGNPDTDMPDNADQWEESRHLAADRIIWLLTDQAAKYFLNGGGITLSGIKIIGDLSLSFSTVAVPLKIQFSRIDLINIECADLLMLNLRGSIISGLAGCGVSIKSLICNDGFTSLKMICLDDAILGGSVNFSGARLLAEHEMSFTASGAQIKGNLVFSRLTSLGMIRLMATHISGQCLFGKAHCLPTSGQAINMQNARINDFVFFDDDFISTGIICLQQTHIGGPLIFDGASLLPEDGLIALDASGIKVEGDVSFRQCQVNGQLKLSYGTVNGNIDFTNGSFSSTKHSVFQAMQTEIRGSIWLKKCTVNGRINLSASKIDHALVIRNIYKGDRFQVNLCYAYIRCLMDENSSWPAFGKLHINGLKYEEINYNGRIDVNDRLKWIRLQSPKIFSSQPYIQLAGLLRNTGHEAEATQVLIEKERDRRKHGSLSSFSQCLNYFLEFSIGYGYRSHRALVISIAIVSFGGYLFGEGFQQNLIGAVNQGDSKIITQRQNNSSAFNSWGYSLDVFLPVIDLQESRQWMLKSTPEQTITLCIFKTSFCLKGDGELLRYYFWSHIILGWLFTSLWVAGFTGLIRRN